MATAIAEPTTTPPATVFRWNSYVHVGDGAQECPDNGASCTDPDHFHGWVRLPNQFLRDELRTDALAARARRTRQYQDPDSNASIVLEGQLAELTRDADRTGPSALIAAIMDKDWPRRTLAAVEEAKEVEGFEHIDSDRARHAELAVLPADERPADEWDELGRHLDEWEKLVTAKRVELEEPERATLEAKGIDELVAILREDRIAHDSMLAFMDRWVRLNIVHGTYVPEPGEKRPTVLRFHDDADLRALSPEVAAGLREAFVALEAGAGPT